MATKDPDQFVKKKPCSDSHVQYNSINLNHGLNNKCPSLNIVHSQSKTSNEKNNATIKTGKFKVDACSKDNKSLWKNSKKDSRLKTLNELSSNNANKEESDDKKRWKKDGSTATSSSTLSLHIAAYENSIDSLNEPKKLKNLSSICPPLKLQDSFEFPRQLEGTEKPTPEIQQFVASQRLFSPNQGSPSNDQINQQPAVIQQIEEQSDQNGDGQNTEGINLTQHSSNRITFYQAQVEIMDAFEKESESLGSLINEQVSAPQADKIAKEMAKNQLKSFMQELCQLPESQCKCQLLQESLKQFENIFIQNAKILEESQMNSTQKYSESSYFEHNFTSLMNDIKSGEKEICTCQKLKNIISKYHDLISVVNGNADIGPSVNLLQEKVTEIDSLTAENKELRNLIIKCELVCNLLQEKDAQMKKLMAENEKRKEIADLLREFIKKQESIIEKLTISRFPKNDEDVFMELENNDKDQRIILEPEINRKVIPEDSDFEDHDFDGDGSFSADGHEGLNDSDDEGSKQSSERTEDSEEEISSEDRNDVIDFDNDEEDNSSDEKSEKSNESDSKECSSEESSSDYHVGDVIVPDTSNSQSNQMNDSSSLDFKRIHDVCGGKHEEYLIVFDSVDKTLCRKLKWNKKEGKFLCNRCNNKGNHVWAKRNGESIKFGPNLHICELQEFIEPRILQKHEYEIRKEPRGKNDVEYLYVFQNGERKKCYKYTWNNKNKYYICNSCTKFYEIYVYAKKFKYENGDDGIILTGKEHQCGLKDFVSIV